MSGPAFAAWLDSSALAVRFFEFWIFNVPLVRCFVDYINRADRGYGCRRTAAISDR